MKNIIIIGSSRVGKSTLASILCAKYNFNYMSGDSIRNAFINIYPELGYTVENTIENKDFCKFINFIINENNIHLKRNIYYVIDSADILIKNAKEIFKNSLIIGIGCKEISAEKLNEECKRHICLKTDNIQKTTLILEQKANIKNYSVYPDNSIRIYDCLDNVRMISKLLTDNEIIIDEISVQGEDLETYFENLIGGRKNV
jgi:hypothetical protein